MRESEKVYACCDNKNSSGHQFRDLKSNSFMLCNFELLQESGLSFFPSEKLSSGLGHH